MDSHFRAFSFVDRITSLEPGASIRGLYAIPVNVDTFPASLVAEAVGQLAAWAAMAAVGFSHRPVAGIAGAIDLLSVARPGQVLDLAAELECVDTESVGYCGSAHVDGRPVLQLMDCVGPMVPLADFDDPGALRERFQLLQADGAIPGSFDGLPPLVLERRESEERLLARAVLIVPSTASLFGDHFPRRPVFPGTLLMHASLQMAAMLAAGVPSRNGGMWLARRVTAVKLRTFIAPGETLNLSATLTGRSEDRLTVTVESRMGQRLAGSAAIQFYPEGLHE
jgi:3-hydroxymyristoyl/3-hydroxydecanoyl-(acyl carrier protein) dehydratase